MTIAKEELLKRLSFDTGVLALGGLAGGGDELVVRWQSERWKIMSRARLLLC